MATKFVEIKHDETGAVGTCPVNALDYWKGRGYSAVDNDAAAAAAEEQNAGPFNPDDHPAKTVKAQLESLDTATPEGQAEYDRIVAAEKAGANRKSAFPGDTD